MEEFAHDKGERHEECSRESICLALYVLKPRIVQRFGLQEDSPE
jgi:hypothetical protein